MSYLHAADVMEGIVNNALTSFYVAIKDGEPRGACEPAARDYIMNGWARTVYGVEADQALRRAREARAASACDPDATIRIPAVTP